MAVRVKCQLILEAADPALDPNAPSAAGKFPNRLILSVPGELSPMVAITAMDHQIPTAGSGDCQVFANNVMQSLGTNWEAENLVYASSIEVSGHWIPGLGFSFRILKDRTPFQSDLDLGTPARCTYLIAVRHLADIP